MSQNIRKQLTLFVDPVDSKEIEFIRKEFNPMQFELIKAHVTLCREDEIQNIEKVMANLLVLTQTEFEIEFDQITRFDNGKGLFLPAKNINEVFNKLRGQVLSSIIDNPRKQEAHITLMHPRNSTCTDAIFRKLQIINLPCKITFNKISLIEQTNCEQWKTLEEFALKIKYNN